MKNSHPCNRLLLLVPLLFALCSGCAGSPKPQKLTPLEELPEGYGDAWRAWYEDAETWPDWRERAAEDPRLVRFLVDNLVRVMVKTYDRAAIARPGEMAGLFERSVRELVWFSDESGPLMVELLMAGDTIVSFLAGDVLVRIDEGRWSLALAQKLKEERVEDRRRAAEWLAKLPPAGKDEDLVWQLLVGALEDSTWAVRAQAAGSVGRRALARGRVDLARPVLSKALGDPEPAVVRAACAALGLTRDLNSVPALINLLERLEQGVDLRSLQSVVGALSAVTGEKEIFGSAGWRQWWRENRPRKDHPAPKAVN